MIFIKIVKVQPTCKLGQFQYHFMVSKALSLDRSLDHNW